MVTSRSVPQQTAQIFSALAGQKRSAFLFSQIGQDKASPEQTGEKSIAQSGKYKTCRNLGRNDFVVEPSRGDSQEDRSDDAKGEPILPQMSDVSAAENDSAGDVDVIRRWDEIAERV